MNRISFEHLLREFMAGRMSSKKGDMKVRAWLRKAYLQGKVNGSWPTGSDKEQFIKLFGFQP